MITKLCEMAELYHTDKAGWYTPFYSLLFEPRRMEFRKILEVGIGTKEAMAHMPVYLPGASLFMWKDYFPFAQVYGVDIEPCSLLPHSTLTDPAALGIITICSDSRDTAIHSKLPFDFDLIVDDGSHDPNVQWETFLNLFPLVKDNGLYIIEDAEDWRDLSERLEGYSHQIVLSPHSGTMGKLILIQK